MVPVDRQDVQDDQETLDGHVVLDNHQVAPLDKMLVDDIHSYRDANQDEAENRLSFALKPV